MFDQLRQKHRAPRTGLESDPVAHACTTLMEAAGVTTWPLHREEQLTLLRRARAATHPDLAGDREKWDRVEDAAKFLRLHRR